VLAASCLWMAVVQMATGQSPLFPRAMFADRNFIIGASLMGLMGMVMMSTMALLPGLMQQIYGYNPLQSGMLMIPRGVGMLLSVTLLGRWLARIEPRVQLAIGLCLVSLSLRMMAHWSIDMPRVPIILSGLLQGLGLSLAFMPISIISFSTLPGRYRTDATSMFNLMRNVGSSCGIAMVTVLLARNVQINHAEISSRISPALAPFLGDMNSTFAPVSGMALGYVDAMVNQQAAMIAYLDDFLVMSVACLAVLPVLLLVRPGGHADGASAATAAADAAH